MAGANHGGAVCALVARLAALVIPDAPVPLIPALGVVVVVVVLLAAWLWWRGGPHQGGPPG
jgi:hypothetical protein